MLNAIHVRNLAVIKEEEILFGKGLNILTGETGAGKSILLGSVNLALGEKPNKAMIRYGADQALVELEFTVSEKEILEQLKQMDVFPEDGCIVMSRKIMENRTVSRINGETVSASVLADVAALLLDIHGQRDNLSLLKAGKQMEMVDSFGGVQVSEIKAQVKEKHRVYSELLRQAESFIKDESQRAREMDLLQHEISEIEAADLQRGEDEELEEAQKKLLNGRKIVEKAGLSRDYLGEDRGICDLLGSALHELNTVSEYDSILENAALRMADAEQLLEESLRELDRYLEDFEFSPERLKEIQERLDLINHLKTKYGNTIEQILEYGEEKTNELEALIHYEERAEQIKTELAAAKDSLQNSADRLTGLRKDTAIAFADRVMDEMRDLNFASVKMEVQFIPKECIMSDGQENCRFCIALNPGDQIKPLDQIASGGELSRIMLAIKTVLSDKDEIPTLIFDEIDTGISGRTAYKVADKLEQIAKDRQVICITHLAQIAARAEHHYLIEKQLESDRSETHIKSLNYEESIREIARILGGDTITETAMRNALELKQRR